VFFSCVEVVKKAQTQKELEMAAAAEARIEAVETQSFVWVWMVMETLRLETMKSDFCAQKRVLIRRTAVEAEEQNYLPLELHNIDSILL
jgi:phytoene/squalene synthetase